MTGYDGLGWYGHGQYRKVRMGSVNCLTVQICKLYKYVVSIESGRLRQFANSTRLSILCYQFILQNWLIICALHHLEWFWVYWLHQRQRVDLNHGRNMESACFQYTMDLSVTPEHPLFWQMPRLSITSFVITTALLKFCLCAIQLYP